MNMATKNNIFEEKVREYWQASKKRKSELLNAVVEVSGLTRKGVIKRFRAMQVRDPGTTERRGRPRTYTTDVIAALKEIWEIGSEACGENLHSQINEYIDIELREKNWQYRADTTLKLRRMSMGSVKAYVGTFVRTRRNFGGKSTTTPGIMSMVPIRMDGWDMAEAGVTQVDTVAHCGDCVAGAYAFTTNGTDVATLWGTRRAQWCKGQEATKESLEAMRQDSPFPWTEVHPDSGKEFINAHCVAYAHETGLRMTRSRPYHKNDNCFVEERNGHVVRAYVGYERLDAQETVGALNNLYDVLTPYLNHFIASRRIVSKERVGARWKVTREKIAQTPYQRVLAREDVPEDIRHTLRALHAALNPRRMKAEIDRLTARVFDVQKRHGHPRKASKSA